MAGKDHNHRYRLCAVGHCFMALEPRSAQHDTAESVRADPPADWQTGIDLIVPQRSPLAVLVHAWCTPSLGPAPVAGMLVQVGNVPELSIGRRGFRCTRGSHCGAPL